MAAGKYNIVIQQGATFSRTFAVTQKSIPVDLTGCTVRSEIRVNYDDEDPVATFVVVLDESAGKFTLSLDHVVTDLLDFETGLYDVQVLRADGTVDRLIQGRVVLSREVTK